MHGLKYGISKKSLFSESTKKVWQADLPGTVFFEMGDVYFPGDR
jgi:hypothetical protein